MVPLVGFAPDMDPCTPGVLTDASNFIPFEGGFKGAPVATTVGADTLAAACRGAVGTSDLSGNRRLISGTDTKLYELSGTTWSDVARAANYALGTDDRWSFVQYANSTIAATPAAVLQISTSGAFADISGAPTAKIVEAAQGFVLAFNTTTSADEWYCSEYLNASGWTLSVSTQCVKGRLIGGSGPITAARRFGDDVCAYKQGTIFVGRYVGAPEVWRWSQVSNDIGCIGQDAVVDTSIGHIFVGRDNVYLYDGTTPRPLATGTLRNWLFANMSPTYRYKTTCLWDRPANLVWIYYPSAGSTGAVDRCVVYHVIQQKWGVADSSIEAAVNYTSATVTYDGGSTLVTTYDTGPMIPFDSLFWISGGTSPAVFNGSHILGTLSGSCASAYYQTGDIGDDEGYSFCDNFRARYSLAPTTSIATGYVKDSEGVLVTAAQSAAMSDGRHNMRQSGRWHRFRVDTTGDFQVTAVRPSFKRMGNR